MLSRLFLVVLVADLFARPYLLPAAGVGVLLHKDPDAQIFVADIAPGECLCLLVSACAFGGYRDSK